MKYSKPEIAQLGSAVALIQGVNKGVVATDNVTGQSMHATSAAYEADE